MITSNKASKLSIFLSARDMALMDKLLGSPIGVSLVRCLMRFDSSGSRGGTVIADRAAQR